VTIESVGADVEFVFTKNGIPMSAIGKIGGTKKEPLWVKGGNLQEDNVLPEMAINPANSSNEFINNLFTLFDQLQDVGKQLGAVAEVMSSINFPDTELDHPLAKEFGCDPDRNAYTMETNQVDADTAGTLRTCGGHIHVGFTEANDWGTARQELIQWMDVHLALPSLFLDGDVHRRKLYGSAGSFREKSYGVEYRTLSNFWMKSKELIQWVWDATHKAHDNMVAGELDPRYFRAIQTAINTSDKMLAEKIMKHFGVAHGPV